MKEQIKSELRGLGLYNLAHSIWMRRPDLRVVCWNVGYRIAGAGDGVPIPPARLMYLVDLSKEVSWYLHTGRMSRDSILYALQRNGYHIEDFGSILDFGCGCGRVMRCWKPIKGPKFYGTDYNPQLIRWCQEKLSELAEFKTDHLAPPLDYADNQFGLIYALSVFTHLPEELGISWINELTRVLKPGGILLITLHGLSRLYQLTPEEQSQFLAGQLVVKQSSSAGSNSCGAYHPEQYVRSVLAKELEVIDFIPEGARDEDQDIYLLKKKDRRQ